jgi:hypothetical protein
VKPPTPEQLADWERRCTPEMYRIVRGAVSQALRLAAEAEAED